MLQKQFQNLYPTTLELLELVFACLKISFAKEKPFQPEMHHMKRTMKFNIPRFEDLTVLDLDADLERYFQRFIKDVQLLRIKMDHPPSRMMTDWLLPDRCALSRE